MSSWLLTDHTTRRSFKIKIPSISLHNVSHTANIIFNKNNSCSKPDIIFAKGDSAASSHFLRPQDAHVLDEIKAERDTAVTLADNDVIGSSHTGQLPSLKTLPRLATKASVLPKLASSSLVSLPQLCDHGCQCLLTKDTLTVVKDGTFVLKDGKGTSVLKGKRNFTDKLWDIPIRKSPSAQQNIDLVQNSFDIQMSR